MRLLIKNRKNLKNKKYIFILYNFCLKVINKKIEYYFNSIILK